MRRALPAVLDSAAMLRFLARRAVAGVEELEGRTYRRSLTLPGGGGVIELRFGAREVEGTVRCEDSRDEGEARTRASLLLGLDHDPAPGVAVLAGDPLLGPLVAQRPHLRVAGCVDGAELAVRAVLGQQVSLAGAATTAARLTARFGEPLHRPVGAVTHRFPHPQALAQLDPVGAGMPAARARAVVALCRAIAAGGLELVPGADPVAARAALLELPGIGPWTAEYVALRALRDPDAFLPTDLGVRRALEALGVGDTRPATVVALAERWRPHRALATEHLWASLA